MSDRSLGFGALVLVLALGMSACSASETFDASDVEPGGSSIWDTHHYIYFNVPEGEECAGARVRWEGSSCFLTFVSKGGENVDLPTVVPDDPSWEGKLRVELPIAQFRAEGAEISLFFEGGGETQAQSTFRYGAREIEER